MCTCVCVCDKCGCVSADHSMRHTSHKPNERHSFEFYKKQVQKQNQQEQKNKRTTTTAKQISKQHLKIYSKFIFIFIFSFNFSSSPCFPPAAKTLKTLPQLLVFLEILKFSCSLVPKLALS